MTPSAIVVLHRNFEEIEAITPIDILKRFGVEVVTASREESLMVTGRSGVTVEADIALDAVISRDFDAVVLPGGAGVFQGLKDDIRVHLLLRRHFESERLCTAICAAPLAMKAAGILDGYRYTAHPSTANELPEALREPVVIDRTIVTSRGAGTSLEYAMAVGELLTSRAKAEEVAASICMSSLPVLRR